MKTIEYTFHFKLTNYKRAKGFNVVKNVSDNIDIDALKTYYCAYFEKLYHTPLKCYSVDKKIIKG